MMLEWTAEWVVRNWGRDWVRGDPLPTLLPAETVAAIYHDPESFAELVREMAYEYALTGRIEEAES